MKAVQKLLHQSKQAIFHLSAEQEVKWHFNPARTPHFGGLWEAGVQVMKTQLHKLVSSHPLGLDELQAVHYEVEAIMSSKHLVAADSVETEIGLVLIPEHFLTGRPMKAPPTGPAKEGVISHLMRWNLVQRLQKKF